MENIKLSSERQNKIKSLWEKFKNKTNEEQKNDISQKVDTLISQWEKYRVKIVGNTLTLDDYTNRLSNSSAKMPGGYLCNFLERTTKELLGSSKPGTAFSFGVKLNTDKSTYHIKSSKTENASVADAENYFVYEPLSWSSSLANCRKKRIISDPVCQC